MNDEKLDEIIKRLDALLQIAFSSSSEMDKKEKMFFLNDLGFQSIEISRILGVTRNAVSVAISKEKKK